MQAAVQTQSEAPSPRVVIGEDARLEELRRLASHPDQSRRERVPYSEELAEQITDYFMQGMSLRDIASQDGMPTLITILKWSKNNTDFRKMLTAARETRALIFEDKAIERATDPSLDPKEVPAARLAYDALKWGAEVSDPATYTKKAAQESNVKQSITFILDTGFPAPLPHQMPPVMTQAGLIESANPMPPAESFQPTTAEAYGDKETPAEAVPPTTPDAEPDPLAILRSQSKLPAEILTKIEQSLAPAATLPPTPEVQMPEKGPENS